jgi:hypothetical protein
MLDSPDAVHVIDPTTAPDELDFDLPHFVGIDGEAVTGADGEHRYVLLCSSEGDRLWRESGISTSECLAWVCQRKFDNPGAQLVAFGLGYDVNMWLRDLGRDKLEKLWREGTVTWRHYRLEWVPGKWFAVSTRPPVAKCYARVFDVFGFFQMSFVRSLDAWGIKPRAELALMKERRSSFDESERQRITNYCLMECADLAELMRRVTRALQDVEIKPRSWVGAGAIASALMRREGVKDHQPDEGAARPDVKAALLSSYYGGRIELFQQGRFMRLTDYDICSAYPSAAVELPSGQGDWRTAGGADHAALEDARERLPIPKWLKWSIWRVQWNVPPDRIVMPFPYRHKRAIYYPSSGQGWYHLPEVLAALELYPEHVSVLGGLVFEPATVHRPFGFVPELYAERRRLKAEGHPAEKVLKLGLNSLYGKLAQGQGFRGQRPPYQSFYWAGRITSQTRARLVRVGAQAPDALVMFATDGIFFDGKAAPDLPTGTSLGDLERAELRNAFIAQPGVYSAQTESGEEIRKSRGFFVRELDFSALWRGWQKEGALHVARYRSRRFIGAGTALMRNDFSIWRTWHESERQLSLYPQRKFVELGGEYDKPVIHHPPSMPVDVLSEPYAPKAADWLDVDEAAEYLSGLEQPLRD